MTLFQGVLHFQVETEGLSWSYIFGQLERNRAALNIVDYSVSQTTLEQVNTDKLAIVTIIVFLLTISLTDQTYR